MGGHALEQGGRTGLKVHVVRDADQEPGGYGLLFGVRARVHGVGNPVAHGNLGDAIANRDDLARSLAAGCPRERGGRIRPFAAGHVGVVDANVVDGDDRFTRAGGGFGHVLVFQHVGSANFVGAYAFHGF